MKRHLFVRRYRLAPPPPLHHVVAERLLAFERYYKTLAKPFEWAFTRQDLTALLQKMTAESLASLRPAA